MLQPHHVGPTFIGLLDRQMHHGPSGSCAMPVNLTGFNPDRIARMNFTGPLAFELHTADARQNVERLSQRMRMPGRPRSGPERYAHGFKACRCGLRDDFVEPDCAREPVGG